MSSVYERELKGILEGDEKILSRVTKTCSALEKNSYYLIRDKPFIVVRAAGSFGVDLVALRGDVSFLMEIKSSTTDTLHFSSVDGKLQRQAEKMRGECEKTRTLPLYRVSPERSWSRRLASVHPRQRSFGRTGEDSS